MPQTREEKNKRNREYNRRKRAEMTPEQLEKKRAYDREWKRKEYTGMATEKKRILKQRKRDYFLKNKERICAKRRPYEAKWAQEKRKRLTPGEKQIRAEKRHVYYQNNKDLVKQSQKKWVARNKESVTQRNRTWRDNNKEYVREYNLQRYQNRSEKDKITHRIRQRLYNLTKVKSFKKERHTEEYLGCTWEEFETYWHVKIDAWNTIYPDKPITVENAAIDHIRPICLFDQDALALGNHYTNMQPLPAYTNLQKNAKWDKEDDDFWFQQIIFNPTYLAPYIPLRMRMETHECYKL